MLSESAEPVIRMRGLGKAYHVFARPEDRLKQMLVGPGRKYYQEFWALRDVDLDIYRGETMGIIGRNGSGKSTLLQMICGTLTPSCGDLTVNGRIAALLELGAGFNPEFTGRDNVFLNGAILGLDRQSMESRYDAIAAFADIGEFLNQPVKTYSSGMYARLAFAVAINVDPEILVVDEALSVGDEAFQRKCFSRLQQIREAGATVLFVSHAAGSIIELCNRAVLLDYGHRLITGLPQKVVAQYQRLAYAPAGAKSDEIREEIRGMDRVAAPAASVVAGGTSAPEAREIQAAAPEPSGDDYYDPSLVSQSMVSYTSRGALISDAHLTDLKGRPVNVLVHGRTYRYCYTVSFDRPGYVVRFGMAIKTISGLDVAGCTSHPPAQGVPSIEAGQCLKVQFEFRNLLATATYFLNAGVIGLTDDGLNWLHRVVDVAMFRVQPTEGMLATCIVDLMTQTPCRIEPVREAAQQVRDMSRTG